MNTFFGIITDCDCTNAKGRQSLRVQSLFGVTPSIIGARSDLEAAGHIVDALDAARVSSSGVILANIAPRNGHRDTWINGSPFCYARIGNALLISTIAGHSLSLVKKLALADSVYVLDIPSVIAWAEEAELVSATDGLHTEFGQFRSFEFSPRVAKWLCEGRNVPAVEHSLSAIPDAPLAAWYVDSFGNCKTTLLPEERFSTRFGDLPFTERLSDVLPNTLSWVIGSSGCGPNRWLELVVNGDSAAEQLALASGSTLV